MDLNLIKYRSGRKRMLILDEFELYQHYLEEELEYEVKQISLDEYLFCVDGKARVRYINCSKVSEEFLRHCLIWDIAFILEDGYEECQEEILDAEELLEEWIREGLWDWKKEVKERNSHGKLSFDIKEMKKKAIQELSDF